MAERLSPYTARVALDFIVIGASITGLACAYNLVRAGHRVRILERDDRISGVRCIICACTFRSLTSHRVTLV